MENTNTKITKLQAVEMMLADEVISANIIYKAYLENEKALLEKKRDNKKATKTQTENEDVMVAILDTMGVMGVKATITEIQNASEDLKKYSNQKLSALVRILMDRGLIVKTTEKGKSLFELVAGTSNAE